ncbi:DUF3421 domain containing protein [Asbolus verrucosus]|uniref:DUF3421 domain containing protein n=1 Tax=Asbolus verrucosus TaxID=1661398 RepID=A0A482VLI2_ASBVE|nr:DUF3421 domain containing protein [Asbolus verrucosus]
MLQSTLSLCVIFPALIISHVSTLQENYYWREYTGYVPPDAIAGGKDINGDDIYIGQAYIRGEGLMVVQIYPGTREIQAAIKGVKKVDKYTKILCGPLQNFSWLTVTSSNLHLVLLNKHAVIGGHEDGQGQINIGRISYEGETKIGKVNSFVVGDASFRFADNNDREPVVKSYEILLYYNNDNNTLIQN